LKQPIYKQIFEECLIAVKKYLALMKTGKRFEKQLLECLTLVQTHFEIVHKQAFKENCYWLQKLKRGNTFENG